LTSNASEEAAITFILPTRNRKDYVTRAIDSCLAIEGPEFRIRVLVIDGNSTDGTRECLTARYASKCAVEIVTQPPDVQGFMATCFYGVERVTSLYATFMYDDDVLSPYLSRLYREVVKDRRSFGMGFGAMHPVGERYPFRPIEELRVHSPTVLVRGWFGWSEAKWTYMPYSPICALVSTEVLRKWVNEVRIFGGKTALRRDLMLRRNVGGDLMVFLMGVLAESIDVVVANQIIAQFSVTDGAFSGALPLNDLRIGYWLARIWAVETLLPTERQLAGKCAGYLAITGVWLACRSSGDKNNRVFPIVKELACLISKVGVANFISGSIRIGAHMLCARVKRKKTFQVSTL